MPILPIEDSSFWSRPRSGKRPSAGNQFSSTSNYLPQVDLVAQSSSPRSPSSRIWVSSNAGDTISTNPDSLSSTQLIQDTARRLVGCQQALSAWQIPASSVPPRPLTPAGLEVARLQAELKRKDATLKVNASKLTVDSVGLQQSDELRQELLAAMGRHSEAKDEIQNLKTCVTRRDTLIQDLEKQNFAEGHAAKGLHEQLKHADSKLARMKVILEKWTSDRDLQKELQDGRELSKLLGIVQASDAAECVQRVQTAMTDLDSHRNCLQKAQEDLQLSEERAGKLKDAYEQLQGAYSASKVEAAELWQQRNQLEQDVAEASVKSCYWEKLCNDSGKDSQTNRQLSELLGLFKASDAGECIQKAERAVADLDSNRRSLQLVRDELQLTKEQIGKMKGANEILQRERDASKVEVAQLQQQRTMFEQKAEEADAKSHYWESQFNALQKEVQDIPQMSKLLGIFQASDAGECVQKAERAVASLDTHRRSLQEVQDELQTNKEQVGKLKGANAALQRDYDAIRVEVAQMQQQRIYFEQTTEEAETRSHCWQGHFEAQRYHAESLQADLKKAEHEQQQWMSDPSNDKLVSCQTELETQTKTLQVLKNRIEDLQTQNGSCLLDLSKSEEAEQRASDKITAIEKQQEQLRTTLEKSHENASQFLRDELHHKSLELMKEKESSQTQEQDAQQRSQNQEQEFQQKIDSMHLALIRQGEALMTEQDKSQLAETRKVLEEINKNGSSQATQRIDALETKVLELLQSSWQDNQARKTSSRTCSIS